MSDRDLPPRQRHCDPESSHIPHSAHFALGMTIPSALLAGPLVGLGLTWLIRRWTGCGEWVGWILLPMGLAAGVLEAIRVIRKLS